MTVSPGPHRAPDAAAHTPPVVRTAADAISVSRPETSLRLADHEIVSTVDLPKSAFSARLGYQILVMDTKTQTCGGDNPVLRYRLQCWLIVQDERLLKSFPRVRGEAWQHPLDVLGIRNPKNLTRSSLGKSTSSTPSITWPFSLSLRRAGNASICDRPAGASRNTSFPTRSLTRSAAPCRAVFRACGRTCRCMARDAWVLPAGDAPWEGEFARCFLDCQSAAAVPGAVVGVSPCRRGAASVPRRRRGRGAWWPRWWPGRAEQARPARTNPLLWWRPLRRAPARCSRSAG